MGQQPYPYTRKLSFRYTFVSKGKARIEKLVVFAPTPVRDIFNLGFGDLLDDGTIDDTANSNNGDLVKVLATVIQILKEFTREYPYAKVVFSGSTPTRTALYRRILKAYYPTFSNEFIISALIPEVVVVTKTVVPVNEIPLPAKFNRMNDMLKKTTFLP